MELSFEEAFRVYGTQPYMHYVDGEIYLIVPLPWEPDKNEHDLVYRIEGNKIKPVAKESYLLAIRETP